jgi:hypothetical protein
MVDLMVDHMADGMNGGPAPGHQPIEDSRARPRQR